MLRRAHEESRFQAPGSTVAPGFRLCPHPATTVLDTGSDVGNFAGVAVYVYAEEVVLVSELEPGWYRYVSSWRLQANGTIRPRFGFGAVEDSCVCHTHHHDAVRSAARSSTACMVGVGDLVEELAGENFKRHVVDS